VTEQSEQSGKGEMLTQQSGQFGKGGMHGRVSARV
jgi:hypothetical protein